MPQITYWQITQDTHAGLITHLYLESRSFQQQIHLLAYLSPPTSSLFQNPIALSTSGPRCLQNLQRAPIFCVIPSPSILTNFSLKFPLPLNHFFTSVASLLVSSPKSHHYHLFQNTSSTQTPNLWCPKS